MHRPYTSRARTVISSAETHTVCVAHIYAMIHCLMLQAAHKLNGAAAALDDGVIASINAQVCSWCGSCYCTCIKAQVLRVVSLVML